MEGVLWVASPGGTSPKGAASSSAQVWELLSNTEHLNRTIGLPSVVYEAPVVTDDDFYRHASIKLLGLIQSVGKNVLSLGAARRRYSVRIFEGGLLERVVGGIELQGEPGWDPWYGS